MAALEIDRWLRERTPAPDLAGTLRCAWWGDLARFRVPLPDECLDITWVDDGTLWLSGPETRSWAPPPPTGATAVGVRFAPGVGPPVLGVGGAEVRDTRVPLAAVWGDRAARQLAERLALAPGDAERVRLLEAAVRPRAETAGEQGRVDGVGRQIRSGLDRVSPLSARRLARDAGLSERQLLRRCQVAFGYGPARLVRILRVQRLLDLARSHSASSPSTARLADLAVTAGYADQQHLAHDVRALFDTTAGALLRPLSDRYKTRSEP